MNLSEIRQFSNTEFQGFQKEYQLFVVPTVSVFRQYSNTVSNGGCLLKYWGIDITQEPGDENPFAESYLFYKSVNDGFSKRV